MSDGKTPLILVSTRKGLFLWGNEGDGWRVHRTAFIGEPVTLATHDGRTGATWAALRHGHFGAKLHRCDDFLSHDATEWQEMSCPAYPTAPWQEAPTVDTIWALQGGGADRPERLWIGTIPGGLFVSEDGGGSWELVRSLWDREERKEWFGGGADKPGIHSIVVDPRDSQHVTVAVSCGGVWQTRDGGQSWEVTTAGMFAEYMPPDRREDPRIQDPHLVSQCVADPERLWCQHHNAMFRSDDAGKSWVTLQAQPSVFGFAVAAHPTEPDTAWFVPAVKDELRVPADGKVVVNRTRDGGRTFETLRDGLPQEHAYDLVYRHALAVAADGAHLAMGSTTGNLWVTDNGGDRWHHVSAHLPPVYAVTFIEQ